MKPIIPASVRGTPSAPSPHSRSGKRVVAVKRIAAWTAIHIRIKMLKKRTRPGAEAVHPSQGTENSTLPGVGNGRAKAGRAQGIATYDRPAEKQPPRPET